MSTRTLTPFGPLENESGKRRKPSSTHTHIESFALFAPDKKHFHVEPKGKRRKIAERNSQLATRFLRFSLFFSSIFYFYFFFFSVLNVKWQETSTEMCYGLEIFIECLQVLLMSFKVAQVALRLVKMSAKLHSQKVLLFPSNGHEIKPKRNSFSPTYYAHGAVSVKTQQLIRWAFAFYVKLQSLAFVLELKLLDNDWKVVAIRILLI